MKTYKLKKTVEVYSKRAGTRKVNTTELEETTLEDGIAYLKNKFDNVCVGETKLHYSTKGFLYRNQFKFILIKNN